MIPTKFFSFTFIPYSFLKIQISMDSTHPYLHPSLSFYLIQPKKSTLEDLYKYIIWDLVARKILSLEIRSFKAHKRDKYVRSSWHVLATERLSTYEPHPFERPVLAEFLANPTLVIRLTSWAKVLYRKSNTSRHFKRRLLHSSEIIRQFLSRSLFSRFNAHGKEFALQLRRNLEAFDKKIQDGIFHEDPMKAKDFVNKLRSNIFLLSEESLSAFAVFRKKQHVTQQSKEVDSETEDRDYASFLFSQDYDQFWEYQGHLDQLFESFFAPNSRTGGGGMEGGMDVISRGGHI